jgi:hypothetical protein
MGRTFSNTFILAGAPIVIALTVLVAGTVMGRISAADPPAAGAPEQWWPVSECSTTTIVAVRGSGITGGALLCVAPDVTRLALYAAGLTPGRSYSAWLLAFDGPRDRSPESLAGDDLSSLDLAEASGSFGGGAAGRDGTLHVQGHVDDHPLMSGSQATILLIDHGRWDDSAAPIVGGASAGRLGLVVGYAHLRLP